MLDAFLQFGLLALWVAIAVPVAFMGTNGLQYPAALFGATGALVLAVPGVNPAWGFAAFLISNVLWGVFGTSQRHWGLLAQQAVFLITSLVGIWNWWLGPLLLGGKA